MSLDCVALNLTDQEASTILNTFIRNSRNFTLLHLILLKHNHLTKIPPEIRLFPRLTQLHFGFNLIGSIRAVDFKFTLSKAEDDKVVKLFLSNNQISYIEPGAFEGIYSVHLI